MANQRSLTDAQIEQFLSRVDDNDDLESDLSEIGILVLTAVKKDQHLSVEELFDRSYCGTKYISVLTKARFQFLMSSYLRFDDKSLRIQLVGDKFAPIRKVWDMFVQKCRENYSPGPYLTVDEQLLAFRGKCSFKMYIPNKPAKYGIKKVMLCDSGTKYMVDAIPYLDRLEMPTITTNLRKDIQNQLQINNSTDSEKTHVQNQTGKGKICAVCPSSKRRMTNVVCAKCQKRLCGEHKIEVCDSCFI
ncbi:PiggyBac transposable element-derived protein 4 [Eumeta japonica]|uniref:PiggyBac transposable element-derived protein 4 n=1 Tax=Eumeta variegata TaxID=151549 RepID=A0A4C1SLI5_EUMVA|nr:PiggyBac transposable element-derived protein 4 [Eumeta japonica]